MRALENADKPRVTDDTKFDLLVVGGGMTGAAIAYLATQVQPPLRVVVLEAGELASGTSSRSSRFLHGGMRYLAQGRLGLVRRLLEGRAELAALAPHLVQPARFLLPLGAAAPHPAWMLRTALTVYGALERRAFRAPGIAPPEHLDAATARELEPLLAGVPLDGALTYGELTVDDAGLVRALASGAQAGGATVRTHVRCLGALRHRGAVVGVLAQDRYSGDRFEVRARVVIDATGPWSGQWQARVPDGAARGAAAARPQRVRLARGTHVVLPRLALPLAHTLVFFAPRDGRALFASPRGQQVVLGTTDVEHHGSADHAVPTRAEVAYLLESLAHALPGCHLRRDQEVTAFSGVRALASRASSVGARGATGVLDRDYAVTWDQPGLLAVRGGKLTLALHGARRAMAALAKARQQLGLPTFAVPGLGALGAPLPVSASLPSPLPAPPSVAARLSGRAA